MPLNNVPNPGQTLNQTRAPINQNFATINTGFSLDHQTFQTARQGVHNQVTMPQLSAAPALTGVLTDLRLYNAQYTPPNGLDIASQIFFQRGTNASPAGDIPITAGQGLGSNGLGSIGWTYLPSGIIVKWGTAQCGSGTVVVPLNNPANGPAFANCFWATAIPRDDGGSGTIGTLSCNQLTGASMTINSTAADTSFIWIALGAR